MLRLYPRISRGILALIDPIPLKISFSSSFHQSYYEKNLSVSNLLSFNSPQIINFQTQQKRMKCYVHLERLPENEIKKCFGKVDLKNQIKIEGHDDLNDQIYNDNVSQSVFLLFDPRNCRIQTLSRSFEST